jgi:hypothetical protein
MTVTLDAVDGDPGEMIAELKARISALEADLQQSNERHALEHRRIEWNR